MKNDRSGEVTIDDVLDKISERQTTLGNKTRSDKVTEAERSASGHAARELQKLKEWIKNGGRNNPLKG